MRCVMLRLWLDLVVVIRIVVMRNTEPNQHQVVGPLFRCGMAAVTPDHRRQRTGCCQIEDQVTTKPKPTEDDPWRAELHLSPQPEHSR